MKKIIAIILLTIITASNGYADMIAQPTDKILYVALNAANSCNRVNEYVDSCVDGKSDYDEKKYDIVITEYRSTLKSGFKTAAKWLAIIGGPLLGANGASASQGFAIGTSGGSPDGAEYGYDITGKVEKSIKCEGESCLSDIIDLLPRKKEPLDQPAS